MCEQLIRKLRFLSTAEYATGMTDSALAMREAAAELDALRKDAECKEELERTMRHLKKTLEKIDKYRLCMSYNDSYFGEPEGTVKRVCSELQHCIDAAIAGEKNHG